LWHRTDAARQALGNSTQVLHGDIRTAAFDSADAVVILDVLHYIAADSQQQVLRRVREALPADGLLLLRVGNAQGGLRFHYGQWIDRIIMLARGHGWVRTHCRSVSQWQQLLSECGFHSAVVPMSEGTPFANFLLVARAR
jgi:cyclopropane fatty-acyl-phospholipid synthase-like methyltransferase